MLIRLTPKATTPMLGRFDGGFHNRLKLANNGRGNLARLLLPHEIG